MENVKYILIVSQYYYSHHCFVVSAAEENFREKALTLIEKLEDYKRDEGDQRDYRYGYPRENAYTDISVRWNVNDSGDIYFIPCQSISSAMSQAKEYNSNLLFISKFQGMPKKQHKKIELNIANHHRFGDIRNIVGSVFEIL